jgi:hypothetical protein
MLKSQDVEYIKYGLFLLRTFTASEEVSKQDFENIINYGTLEIFLNILSQTDNLNIFVTFKLL